MNHSTPNAVIAGNGFHIRYNDVDDSIYGGATTALVQGLTQHSYILDGDHRDAYQRLVHAGFNACLMYYRAHRHLANRFTELLPEEAWAAKVAAMPMEQRAAAIAEEVIAGGEISWGEALRQCYPEMRSGDLPPGADTMAIDALTALTQLWVQSNRPDPGSD